MKKEKRKKTKKKKKKKKRPPAVASTRKVCADSFITEVWKALKKDSTEEMNHE